MVKAKATEATELLLRGPTLSNLLFGFSEPFKIGLEAYMNRYFTYNVPLSQFAKLTSRGLSMFKRYFKKIFDAASQRERRSELRKNNIK